MAMMDDGVRDEERQWMGRGHHRAPGATIGLIMELGGHTATSLVPTGGHLVLNRVRIVDILEELAFAQIAAAGNNSKPHWSRCAVIKGPKGTDRQKATGPGG